MSFLEQIVERRIAEGQAEGLFDDLDGHGQPIADLDHPRPEGWFARRLVRDELDGGLTVALIRGEQ